MRSISAVDPWDNLPLCSVRVAVVLEDRISDCLPMMDCVSAVLAPTRPKRSHTTVLMMPDFYFIQSRGYRKLKRYVQTHDPPWSEKRDTAVWRGSSNGRTDPRHNARICFCRKHKSVANVGITQVCHRMHVHVSRSASLSVAQQLQHRYQIDLEGYSCSWDGLYWKLLSGSAVLRVQQRDEQWYHKRLRPWIHYVPCTRANFARRLAWCRLNPKKCRAMAAKATRVIKSMTYASEVKKFCRVLIRRLDLRLDVRALRAKNLHTQRS